VHHDERCAAAAAFNVDIKNEERVMKISELLTAFSLPPLLLAVVMATSLGCENKEKVLDVETPSGQVEVERDRDTGAIDVEANKPIVDIDTPGADIEVNRDRDDGGIEIND
jgi:hypothetical protein